MIYSSHVVGVINRVDGRPSVKVGQPIRRRATAADLASPACPLPRPGDTVIWYQDTLRQRGRLIAHTAEGWAVVAPDGGGAVSKLPFDAIRLDDPSRAIGPMWQTMPPSGAVFQPTESDFRVLDALLGSVVPPGISHRDLADEIWLRGFEVFLGGSALRGILTAEQTIDAELVTTMPMDRLIRLCLAMYGEDSVTVGDRDRRKGCLRVGGRAGTADPAANVRLFRYDSPGSPAALIGTSFVRDMLYGDFTCHSVFYEPTNRVLIDPCGRALADAEQRFLSPTYDAARHSPQEQAVMGLRVIDLRNRGYTFKIGSEDQLMALIGYLPALPIVERAAQLQMRVFGGATRVTAELWEEIHAIFIELGIEEVWQNHVAPCWELVS